MATFGGPVGYAPSNGFSNNFYGPDIHGPFHHQQNNTYIPDQQQNFQNTPGPQAAPHPYANPYPGFGPGQEPTCPQWIDYRGYAPYPADQVYPQPITTTQENRHAYPYPHGTVEPQSSRSHWNPGPPYPYPHGSVESQNFRPPSNHVTPYSYPHESAGPQNTRSPLNHVTPYLHHHRSAEPQISRSPSNPVLPLRFSALKENFMRNSEQINPTSSQPKVPVNGFKESPTVQGQQMNNFYGQQHSSSLLHLNHRPPPETPFGQPTMQPIWSTHRPASLQSYPRQLDQGGSGGGGGGGGGPYLQNWMSLKVSPSLFYSQSVTSHPNSLSFRHVPSVEYPETSEWSRREGGGGEGGWTDSAEGEGKEEGRGRKGVTIPANRARAIVAGLSPMPPHLLMQATPRPRSVSSPPATETEGVPGSNRPEPSMPWSNGGPYSPGPNGVPYNSGPNGGHFTPGPNRGPYTPGPNGGPYYSGPNVGPYNSGTNGDPYNLGPNGGPFLSNPNGVPGPSGVTEGAEDDANAGGITRSADATGGPGSIAESAEDAAAAKKQLAASGLEGRPEFNCKAAKVLAWIVILLFGGLLWGVLAFIFALEAENRHRKGETKKALRFKGLSFIMSIVGIICGLMGAIVAGVLVLVYRT